jgi:hypothetical protein
MAVLMPPPPALDTDTMKDIIDGQKLINKGKTDVIMTGFAFPLYLMLLIHGSFLGACDDGKFTVYTQFCITGLVFGAIILLCVSILCYHLRREDKLPSPAYPLKDITKNLWRSMMMLWGFYFFMLTQMQLQGELFPHYPEPLMRQLPLAIVDDGNGYAGSRLYKCCDYSAYPCNCICSGGPTALFDSVMADTADACFAFGGGGGAATTAQFVVKLPDVCVGECTTGTPQKVRMVSLRTTGIPTYDGVYPRTYDGVPVSQFEIHASDSESLSTATTWTRILAGPLEAMPPVSTAEALRQRGPSNSVNGAYLYDFYFGGESISARYIRFTALTTAPVIDNPIAGAATNSPTSYPSPAPLSPSHPTSYGPYFGLSEIEVYGQDL